MQVVVACCSHFSSPARRVAVLAHVFTLEIVFFPFFLLVKIQTPILFELQLWALQSAHHTQLN